MVSQWRQVGSAMEAQLGGVTIIWTPNNGPEVQALTTYPGVTEALENILVHPVTEGTDSQLEIYPASDDMTWQDCIQERGNGLDRYSPLGSALEKLCH